MFNRTLFWTTVNASTWQIPDTSVVGDYFISNSGNDNNDGLTPETAWQTIAKVNATSFSPGDIICFKRGDSWNGTIDTLQNGSLGSPITFTAYGTGASPVITGFTTITEWTDETGGIYSKVISIEAGDSAIGNCAIVSLDGVNTPMGRYPNTGWMTIDSHNTNISLTDADLNSTVTNWTGAEAVIRVNLYVINHVPITGHTNQTISFSGGTVYNLIDGYGYFIQNDLRTLTSYGEWYYDTATSKFYMYFGAELPTNHIVKVGTINRGVTISSQSYITFDGLTFNGFNSHAFYLSVAPYITIQNCNISFCGGCGIRGQYGGSTGVSSHLLINNNIIDNVNTNGIEVYQQFTNITISNNLISNVGLIRGTGYSKDIFTSQGINVGNGSPGYTMIEYNNIINIGYVPIDFMGNNANVRYNYVDNFGLIKDDGGGIYTYQETGDTRDCSILYNIVLNGIGEITGTTSSGIPYTSGIYTDGFSNGIKIIGNSVYNCAIAGYFSNSNIAGKFTDNTCYDNRDNGAYFSNSAGMANMDIQRNIFFGRSTPQRAIFYTDATSPIPASTTLNNNCYTRPIDDTDIMIYWERDADFNFYTLAQWKTATGKDVSSYKSPVTVDNVNKLHFIYNASTGVNKTFTLDASMVDVHNTVYSSNVTLSPYTSLILIGAGTVS
jgi:hypothetical protein